MTTIDPRSARELIATGPDTLVVDVRTPGEFASAHLPGAINLPLDQVDAHLRRIVADAGGRMILVCQSGRRAAQCQAKLAAAGLADTAVLDGGMIAWTAADGPVVKGRKRWDLERQVRLVAGGIVLISVLASLLWPAAVFFAGLIGAGLTFAALRNSCLMGMLLARLPYNRVSAVPPIEDSLRRLAGAGR
ncbi:rhodanese-like domain-containing protein [Glycomyces rhizosphaerae]|uniref:Rhodanese-like domain-containing protein n=1 Tax=Glycomyces rhizosphaerae TaxID=2054422 RepID=A0ABV7PVM7_9ACTN